MPMTRLSLGIPNPFVMSADDGAGGGGGGGGGDGGDGKGGKGGGDGAAAAAGLSEEMKKEITKHVSGAVANYSKRIQADLMATLTTTLEEKLKGFQPVKVDGDGGTGGGDGKGGAPPEDPDKKRMRAELDSLTKKLEQQTTERQQDAERALRSEERNELTARLREAGIPEPRLRGAVAYLLHDTKAIRRDKENKIVWPVKRDWGEEELPFEKGVEEWLGTEEGKAYLPPKDAKGSGTTGGKTRKPGEKMTAAESSNAIADFIFGHNR